MQHAPLWGIAFPFIVWGVIGIPIAFGNAFLARRLGKSAALWAILSIIPIVNFVFVYYIAYKVVYAVLDRLAGLADDMRRLAPTR
jgi:hypothetical protein